MSNDNDNSTIRSSDKILFLIAGDIGSMKSDVSDIRQHIDVLNSEHGELLLRVQSLEKTLMTTADQKQGMNDLKNTMKNWVFGAVALASAIAGIIEIILHFW